MFHFLPCTVCIHQEIIILEYRSKFTNAKKPSLTCNSWGDHKDCTLKTSNYRAYYWPRVPSCYAVKSISRFASRPSFSWSAPSQWLKTKWLLKQPCSHSLIVTWVWGAPNNSFVKLPLGCVAVWGVTTQPFLLLSFIHVRPESWSDDSSSFFVVVVVPSLFCLM